MSTLYFTLGPVQEFIAQARRTRDLWAGSFLLSWLSAQAMKAVLDQGGTILFPAVTDRSDNVIESILKAVNGNTEDNEPQIGSIPSRFKASVPAGFEPEKIETVIHDKWQALANAVYTKFVAPAEDRGNRTRDIWDRQINHFWQINWVLGDAEDDQVLDIRKHWRSHWPHPEGGDHCTMMGDYQELSGHLRIKDRQKQNEFWNKIRGAVPDDHLDIRDNERLCAIALLKRLFPRLSKQALMENIGWVPGGKPQAVGNWPSTTYLAVSEWLAGISSDRVQTNQLNDYLSEVHKAVGDSFFCKLASERATRLSCLDQLNAKPMSCARNRKISDIDGSLLHVHALANYRATYLSDDPLTPDRKDNTPALRKALIGKLQNLYRELGSKPRSYYALLLMDGDQLGEMMQQQDQTKVSSALLAFTENVESCVNKNSAHSGVTVYAGGDDVFALLPLHTAIDCASALRTLFAKAFDEQQISATASTAIVFAHHQVPLQRVIEEAHYQLDSIAKDRNGRDSLALAIYKPGGITAQWVSAWGADADTPIDALQKLVSDLKQGDRIYPRGFFHKLRDRYGLYEDEAQAALPDATDAEKLLIAEYMQSRNPSPTLDQARQAIKPLKTACHPLRRDSTGQTSPARVLTLDGGFIARFLTQQED